ncbi:MAG: hypothetical protein U0525_01870 [Patescibacteria group bacterium]
MIVPMRKNMGVSFLENAIFPPICSGCKSFGVDFCKKCISTLVPLSEIVCLSCGKTRGVFGVCGCDGSSKYGDVFVLWNYEKVAQNVIHTCKYNFIPSSILNLLLYMRIEQLVALKEFLSHLKNSALLPMPISKARFCERGFNQSLIIANAISEISGTKLLSEKNIVGRKTTKPLATLQTKVERENAVLGVFEVIDPKVFQNKTIVVVDDVLTSGSTIKSLARTIYPYSNSKIYGIVLAHERRKI